MYLSDTNMLSEMSRPAPNPRVARWFGVQQAIAISSISVEELSFGVERAPPDKQARLRVWLESTLSAPMKIIPVDDVIARVSAQLRATRSRIGRPVNQADMLIAATALVTGRTLVTRNVRDFENCNVQILNPFEK